MCPLLLRVFTKLGAHHHLEVRGLGPESASGRLLMDTAACSMGVCSFCCRRRPWGLLTRAEHMCLNVVMIFSLATACPYAAAVGLCEAGAGADGRGADVYLDGRHAAVRCACCGHCAAAAPTPPRRCAGRQACKLAAEPQLACLQGLVFSSRVGQTLIVLHTHHPRSELCDLVKEVQPAARRPSARLSFSFVYPDRRGHNVMRNVCSRWGPFPTLLMC